MNTMHLSEKKGQEWYQKTIKYLFDGDYASFNKQMEQAKENYQVEHEILGCIGQLTESGKKIDDVKAHPDIVLDIKIASENPISFKLKTIIGEFTFTKLSDFLPRIKDETIENSNARQRLCHEKALEIAIGCPDNLYLVTGFVSVLSDINTFIHSWVEWEDGEAVLDYTLNAVIGIKVYKELMHPTEPPLLRISNKDLRSGQISIVQWKKQIHDLYKS